MGLSLLFPRFKSQLTVIESTNLAFLVLKVTYTAEAQVLPAERHAALLPVRPVQLE